MESEGRGGGTELHNGWEDSKDEGIAVPGPPGLTEQESCLTSGKESLQQAELAPVLARLFHLFHQLFNRLLVTQTAGLHLDDQNSVALKILT